MQSVCVNEPHFSALEFVLQSINLTKKSLNTSENHFKANQDLSQFTLLCICAIWRVFSCFFNDGVLLQVFRKSVTLLLKV